MIAALTLSFSKGSDFEEKIVKTYSKQTKQNPLLRCPDPKSKDNTMQIRTIHSLQNHLVMI